MNDAIQSVAQQAIESPSADNPLFWIGVGVVLAIQVADKVVLWFRTIKGKGSPMGDNGIRELTLEVKKLTETINKDYVARVRQQEQVEDLFDWHSPDGDGEQKWKGAAIFRKICAIEGTLKSLIADINASFKDLFRRLQTHIDDDAKVQNEIKAHLVTIERK